jgi:hypothetical protein
VYLFGQLGAAGHAVADEGFGKRSPLYVLEREDHCHFNTATSRVTRSTTADGGHYWSFSANLRCRDLGLSIDSNEPAPVVHKIATHILHSARC